MFQIVLPYLKVYTPFTGQPLFGEVFVRLQLSCQKPIEFAYYASAIGRKGKCCYCGADGGEKEKDLLKKHKVVLPRCKECEEKRKPVLKRNPLPNQKQKKK